MSFLDTIGLDRPWFSEIAHPVDGRKGYLVQTDEPVLFVIAATEIELTRPYRFGRRSDRL